MKPLSLSPLFLLLVLLSACVTINIYFPAAQAKEAAEKIVDDIIKVTPTPPQPAPDAGDQGSAAEPEVNGSALGVLLEFLVPSAHAAQPDFSVNTPEVRRIQAALKQRHGALAPYYASGAVGFANNGLVAVRDAGAVKLRDRGRVQRLVQDENDDRNRLYREIAKANGHPEWEKDVRKVFARTWVEKAKKGWWYQNAGGAWVKK